MSNAHRDWLIEEEAERQRARNAVYCCQACGEKWGERRADIETIHQGKCEVCLMDDVTVYPARFYGWLKRVNDV